MPSLTPEMRQALDAGGGLPIQIEDPLTHKLYLVVEKSEGLELDSEYLRTQVEIGLADIEAGRVVPWNPERIKSEGRRKLADEKRG